ncbi:hypothetical protein FKW77_000774 [Venturia effusa]|uniref:Uncharacterized protein n=1 Tax=Venturia effusa TaxID=50376 RepID=A0A517L8J3_9PEZI|nr:hypothetical protein FKW77_000774 [Venturia effusa]
MLRPSEKLLQSSLPQTTDIAPDRAAACLAKRPGNADLTLPVEPPASDVVLPAYPPPPYSFCSLPPTPYHQIPPPAHVGTATIEETTLQLDSQSPPKNPLNFRLPSFQLLGIAAPHPNHIPVAFDASIGPLGPGPLSAPHDPLHTMNPFVPVLRSRSAVRQYVLTQTPPDDNGVMNWTTDLTKSAVSDPTGSQGSSRRTPASDADATPADLPAMALTPPTSSFTSESGPWINQALPSILDNVSRNSSSEHLRVLSHALPSPSSEGHAFPAVIDAIQQATGPNQITWVNIFHAVSGKFSLADLPKSPPSTPAPPGEGDDYFTSKLFNMAVEVPDYSEKIMAKPLLQKLRPAISPSSIDISVVERYIPPTSSLEFEELFSSTGRSFLSDRLIELSTKHGTLLFIYPTKIGGTTFRKEYLAPILDPILREMGTTHDLSIDLLQVIGNMPAIDKLLSFEEMQARLQEFCRSLSIDGSTPHGRYHAAGATYTVVHAAPRCVPLTRTVWAEEWWAKQEKTKIQKAFENHDVHKAGTIPGGDAKRQLATAKKETQAAARPGVDNRLLLQRAKTQELIRAYERTRGEKRPDDNEMLILKLLKDVVTKPYGRGEPEHGVEVGVFVIQKTLRQEGTVMNDYV